MSSIFSQHSIDFLQGLQDNNNKPWFQAHEAGYRQYVLAPLVGLVEALSETMLEIDSNFEMAPKVSKTISRIYRDTRFSRDKSLYHSHMWITFKRPCVEWQDAPGYFFEIEPDRYVYGMGLYKATHETMDAFRARLEAQPDEFRQIISFLDARTDISVGGDLYKKTLTPSIPNDLQSWYQRKTCYLLRAGGIDARLFAEGFVNELAEEFRLMAPLYQYFWALKDREHSLR